MLVCGLWALAFLLADAGWSQNAPVVYQGSWTASAGGDQYLRGTWSGQMTGTNRNAAQGSWTLVIDSGDILMQGTWAARKTAQVWEGTWTARIANGGSLSGSWSADLKASDGKSLEEMLARTMQKQVASGWQSGRRQGYWWLDGTGGKKKR
jgi:hypothetical protein